MAGDKAAALQSGRFLVAGSVGRLIQTMPEFLSVPALSRHTTLLGFVQQELLQALYDQAHVVVLPKVYGGGSNLKTAEALLSGRPIVGNDGAFIGFEPYRGLGAVHIENDPRAFWTHVAELLRGPAPKKGRLGKREELEWSQCLIPMVKRTEALVADRGARRKAPKPGRRA
jgi:glycosyltransferase involved in cell wall biosynthesis